MTTFNTELVEALNTAKKELHEAYQFDLGPDVCDACWDDVEQCWYALLDEYDSRELERHGITPEV